MNITHGLRRALQINPNGLATVFGERRRNWREIGDRVARLAAALRALGVKAGDRVAILSLNSDRYLETLSRHRLGRRRDRAAQHPLEPARERRRDARLPRPRPGRRQGVCAGRHSAGESRSRPEADLCRRRRRACRHGELRGAARASEPVAGRDAPSARPRRHLLHRRHHRPLQRRDAQPRQPDGQCAERAGRRPVSAAARSICTPRRCSTSPMARRCIRCCSAAAPT